MEKKGNLFILNFGNDEFDACRFFTHAEAKTVEEFEEDRLDGMVPFEVSLAENIGVLEFEEQIARLRMKGYVELDKVMICHVTNGQVDEL